MQTSVLSSSTASSSSTPTQVPIGQLAVESHFLYGGKLCERVASQRNEGCNAVVAATGAGLKIRPGTLVTPCD